MNTPRGFLYEPIQDQDFVFGGSRSLFQKFKGEPLTDGDWRPFLYDLIYSHQAPGYETNSCTIHGLLNAVELLAVRVFGYTLDLSDRFVAAQAGIDPARGATPKVGAEWLRKNWSVNENEWPTADAKSVEEFYQQPPNQLRTLAIARGAEFDFGYEYITPSKENIKAYLPYSPVCISVALLRDENLLYYKPTGWRDTHWLTVLAVDDDGNYVVLDSYPDTDGSYIKKIRGDFVPEVAMGYYLRPKVKNQSAFQKFMELIYSILGL